MSIYLNLVKTCFNISLSSDMSSHHVEAINNADSNIIRNKTWK